MNDRPTNKELTGKIRKALELLSSPSDGFSPVDPLKLGVDFYKLALFSEEEQREGLRAALNEVTAKSYSGRHPPERAFECAVKNEEIFTFRWQSAFFKKKMYLKFCFHDSDEYEGEDLYIFSLHEDQPGNRVTRKKK